MIKNIKYQISNIKCQINFLEIGNWKLEIPGRSQVGFTLIELIVVIGVVAVLSTALLSVLNPVEQIHKARDTQRRGDLSKIQAALEFVRSDFGCYPASGCSGPSLDSVPCNEKLVDTTSGVTYLDRMPCDPTTKNKYYYSSTNGSTYTLTACLERLSDPQKKDCPEEFSCSSEACTQVENP